MTTRKPIVDPSEPVNYRSLKVPETYACSRCSKTGVKLWRHQDVMLSNLSLSCAECSSLTQGVDVSDMQLDGSLAGTIWIGVLVPAIPTADNDNFWGVQRIPSIALGWWRRLPNDR